MELQPRPWSRSPQAESTLVPRQDGPQEGRREGEEELWLRGVCSDLAGFGRFKRFALKKHLAVGKVTWCPQSRVVGVPLTLELCLKKIQGLSVAFQGSEPESVSRTRVKTG